MSAPLEPSTTAVAGVILASGSSRRFRKGNKLLAAVDGSPVVRRTTQAYLDGGLEPVIVVVGYEAHRVVAALVDLDIVVVQNPDFVAGQSRSLVRGVRALAETRRAAVIGVGDQPMLSGDVVRTLVKAYRETAAPLVVPRYAGRRGNPALFARSLFPELELVEGDQGGRPVLAAHKDEIVWVDFADPLLGMDVDTVEDYATLLS
jgi:molybdenum cofactor cytidylyltransferase